MRRAVMAGVVLVVLAAAGGCGGAEVVERDDGVRLVVAGGSSGGMDSRLRGDLALLEGDCVGVDADGTQYLVAWPPGTELAEGDEVVVTMAGRDYAPGDEVQLAGGAVQVAESSQLPELPEECAAEEIFLVNDQ